MSRNHRPVRFQYILHERDLIGFQIRRPSAGFEHREFWRHVSRKMPRGQPSSRAHYENDGQDRNVKACHPSESPPILGRLRTTFLDVRSHRGYTCTRRNHLNSRWKMTLRAQDLSITPKSHSWCSFFRSSYESRLS